RSVALAGATGLVGTEILRGLVADPGVSAIHVLARRAVAGDAKVTAHIVDLTALPALPHVDEVYLTIGTTIKVAGSQAAIRAVDYDANLAVARAALAAGAQRAGLVSAMGASARSRTRSLRCRSQAWSSRGLPCWPAIAQALASQHGRPR